MAPTLADLLTAKTPDVREAQLLAALNANGFPTTDWYPGAVGRTIVKMITTGLVDFDDLVPQIASGGFLGPIKVGDVEYPTRDWLELLAEQLFNVTPAPATFAQQSLALWCAVGSGPYPIASVEQLTAVSVYGNHYRNVTTGTVVAGTLTPTKLRLIFQAESAGAAFNKDASGAITKLVTPLPGLFVSNEPLSIGGVDGSGRAIRYGSGTGTATPAETVAGNSTAPARTFAITVLTAGQVGAAIASMLVSDGVNPPTTVPLSPIPASLNAGGGITIAFANGAQNPSFLAGEIYTFQTLGSPIINPGSDEESSASIRARCRGRWPALSAVPTEDRYAGWVRQCSIDSGFGITKVTVNASVTVAGFTEIRVATDAGAVPGGVVTAVQTYVDKRDGIVDKATVASAVNKSVTAGGTVTIRSADAAATKAAAELLWQQYLADLPIGGERRKGGVVVLAELEQAFMDAGAIDVSGLTLNTVAANLALAVSEVAVEVPFGVAITWLEVA